MSREPQSNKFLAALGPEKRERLRRLVIIGVDDDHVIATKADCAPQHVIAMRNRLISLGVLARAMPTGAPRKQRAPLKPAKYRNGELFEDT